MDDFTEIDSTPRLSVRGCLLGARPVAGALGASGLKILACSWFALGLGTLGLLSKASGAHRTLTIVAESARPDRDIASTSQRLTDRASASKSPALRRRHTPHTAPAESAAGAATLDAPQSPSSPGAADASVTGAGSSTASGGPASPPPATPPVVSEKPVIPPPPSVLDVLPLPPLPSPPDLPGPSATSGLGLP